MSGPIRGVMIVDLNNPKSVRYSDIALKTFSKCKKIEIERRQCVTPDNRHNVPFRLSWQTYHTAKKWRGQQRMIPQTEKCCFTSHFREWYDIANSGESHIILEHDAYLRNQSKFEHLIETIQDCDLWNCGIAMECYTLSPEFANYVCEKFLNTSNRFPDVLGVSAGPMAELHYHMDKMHRTCRHRHKNIMWPDMFSRNRIATCYDPRECVSRNPKGIQTAPVTQCFSPNAGQTVDHGHDLEVQYGGKTLRQMEVIENIWAEET